MEQREDEVTPGNQFLAALLEKRDEAIAGRKGSGIEVEWEEDEEHYQGIDDANRQYQNTAMQSSAAKRWAETGSAGGAAPTRSVVFLNITRPYVDAGSARISDMLMPTDDRAWTIRPSPIPRLTKADIMLMGGQESAQAIIAQETEIAKAAAEAMQGAIDDCLVESSFHGEMRRVIEDASRIGTGVIKGPFPIRREYKLAQRGTDGTVTQIDLSEIRPGSKRISAWNLFPDPSCGDDIHMGSYIWEREYISKRQVKDLLKMDGYDHNAIKEALKEGAKQYGTGSGTDGPVKKADAQFEMWIFHGACDAKEMQALGVDYDGDDDKLPAMAVLINDRLVKVTMSAIDSGEFPYDVLAWQHRPGMPWGMGIARQIRTVQRILNGSVRAMMDNAGEAATPDVVYGNGITRSGRTGAGRREWRLEADATIQDVRAAINWFTVPSVQPEMMNIINFALKMAEDTTGMPAMLQGIRGDAPNTLGGMQMQNNNATSVLRRLAKRFDDCISRPHIQRYFDWMMVYSDDDSIKGDLEVEVRASSALVERDAQQQFMMQMLSAAANPVYELSPARFAEELIKGQRLDVKRFKLTEDEKAATNKSNPVDDAKAELITAQVDKVKAETATKNVEGMFSATEAAKNIAMAPMLAPAADAMWKSAGGEDKDMAPAIPQIEGVPAMPPESNTNPLTPANPTSPLIGLADGIEGGQD